MSQTAEKLRLLRVKNKKSEEDMAALLGISRPTYRRTEEGMRELNVKEVDKLETFFNLSAGYFSEDKGTSVKESETDRYGQPEIDALKDHIKSLKEQVKLLSDIIKDGQV